MEKIDIESIAELLPGFIQRERFYALFDWHLNNYFSQDTFFSILVIDFEVKESQKFLINKESVIKYVSTAINSIIARNIDGYSIDSDKFVILLVDKSEAAARVVLEKINKFIKQKYSQEIIVSAGISECPDDAISYRELINIANNKMFIIDEDKAVESEPQNYSETLNKSLADIENSVKSSLFKELSSLLEIINSYDPYLGSHSALVTRGSILLAKEIGISWREIEKLSVAALLHDIGYTALPKEIYNKKGKLSNEEWKIIKMHPSIASEHILKGMPLFAEYLPIISNHHEFLDGSGYPFGLKGDSIPLGSQIISIVDTYHAMKSDRPYRKAMPFEDIIDYYIKHAGIKWHETLITIFTAILADNELNESLDKNEEFNISLIINNQ